MKLFIVGFGLLLLSGCASYAVTVNTPMTGSAATESYSIEYWNFNVVNEIGSIKGHETIYAVISLTVLLSIILHGISAQPFARLYARKELDK